MTKLQVELAKANKRITKAVRKHIECEKVSLEFNQWGITTHAWSEDSDILATVRAEPNSTINQVTQKIHKELRKGFVVHDNDIPF